MPILDKAAKLVTNRMPKVISPRTHAIIDYAMAASFFGMAAFFGRRNKRAAVSALLCGAAETITSLCTDYPGGVVREINFKTHGTIDFALSGLAASLPGMLRFNDEPGSKVFQGAGHRDRSGRRPYRFHRQRRKQPAGRYGQTVGIKNLSSQPFFALSLKERTRNGRNARKEINKNAFFFLRFPYFASLCGNRLAEC